MLGGDSLRKASRESNPRRKSSLVRLRASAALCDNPAEESAALPLIGAANGAGSSRVTALCFLPMFNFSANHLFLLSRTEYRSCAVFLLQDRDTQRVYRLYDFTKAQLIRPNVAYCVAGKVNSADKLFLVIE